MNVFHILFPTKCLMTAHNYINFLMNEKKRKRYLKKLEEQEIGGAIKNTKDSQTAVRILKTVGNGG